MKKRMGLRSLAVLPVLVVGSCSLDRGFRFYGEYEAEQSHYRIQLISQGYVKPGDDLANSAFVLVQFCPTGQSSGKAIRMTLTAAPGQWNKIESDGLAIPSGEWNWRTSNEWLKEALAQAGYRDVAEEEIKGSVRVIESSLAGPKGVILKGQIKSLLVRRADIVYGYKVIKDRPPGEWIGSSELAPCGRLTKAGFKSASPRFVQKRS
jgi:hypothetical protein